MFNIAHCADSFDFLRRAPDNFADVVITDPPYDAHCQANRMSGSTLAKVNLDFKPLESLAFLQDVVRVAKRWAIVFCTIEDIGVACKLLGRRDGMKGGAYVRGGVWYKPNSMGQLSGDRPAASYEGVLVLHKPGVKMRWRGRGGFAFWACSGTRGEKDRHDNQKPLKLCLELVNKFSDPGESVFDPFSGSGRIGEACQLLGRHYGGLDSDPYWVNRARERCAAAPWESQMAWLPCEACQGTGVIRVKGKDKTCQTCNAAPLVWRYKEALHNCRLEEGDEAWL